MKIGIVLSKPPSYSETFFLSKIKGLREHGYIVVLFVQSNTSGFGLCEVKVAFPVYRKNLVKQLWWFMKFAVLFLRYFVTCSNYAKQERKMGVSWSEVLKKLYVNIRILTEKVDWLHFGFATMALGKENVANAIGAKMAVSFRGFDMAIYPIKNPYCYKQLWKQVDKVHSISDDLYALALKQGLSKEIPYQKITPAIDVNVFKATDNHKNFDQDTLKMITVARLHWKKGLTYTFQALKIMKDNGINFRYTIVGEGEEYEKLMYIRHILNLEKEVELLGKVSHTAVKELLENHDIYLQYSISEGFCNAVLEAQGMGLLCVVSDAEGLSENVLHEKSGWVVEKRKPEKLAECLGKLVDLDESSKRRIQEFAINRVRQEFNLEKQQHEFLNFYE